MNPLPDACAVVRATLAQVADPVQLAAACADVLARARQTG